MASKIRLIDGAMYSALACALLAGAAFIYQEVSRSAPTAAQPRQPRPMTESEWRRFAADGHVIGSVDAPVRVVEYGDYQCPACARFATVTWPAVRRRFGDTVALVYRHWPLGYHEHAYAATRAAECAAAQGAFEAFHALLYRQQGSIGARPFADFAAEAGVPDLEAFRACSEEDAPLPAVEEAISEVQALGGTGTPTIFVGGRRVPPPADSAKLFLLLEEQIRKLRH